MSSTTKHRSAAAPGSQRARCARTTGGGCRSSRRPLLTVLLGYVVVRLFMRQWYWVGEYNYLTPLYSPCISESCHPGLGALRHDLRRPAGLDPAADRRVPRPAGLPRHLLLLPQGGLPVDPAEPDGLRRRGAGPPLPRREPVPFVFMNSHRYFFYLASLLLLINTYDAVLAFFPRRRVRLRPRVDHPRGQRPAAVGLHARLPRVPAHRRRQAQALLAQPAALRDVEPHLEAQRAAHAVRLGVAGERDPDRRLHHGRLGRMDLRPADRGGERHG